MVEKKKQDEEPQIPPPPPRQPDESLKGYIERGNKVEPASNTRDDGTPCR